MHNLCRDVAYTLVQVDNRTPFHYVLYVATNSSFVLCMNSKGFFAGLEEVASRLLSVILCFVFFLIYISARDGQQMILDWPQLLVVLGIFWFVYESISYIMYAIFSYFSRQNEKIEEPLDVKVDESDEDKRV